MLGKGVTRENNLFFAVLQITGTADSQLSPKFKAYLFQHYNLHETADTWTAFKPENPADENKELDALDNLYQAPWKKEDHPRFADWLAKNADALARLSDAAGLDHYMIPLWGGEDSRMINVTLPFLGRYREYANALCDRATLRLGSGDLAGCQRDLLAAHRLGRLITQGGAVIERLLGIAIETRASLTDVTLAASDRLSAPEVAAYLEQLDKLPELRPTWEAVNLGERCFLLDEATRIARKGRASLVELTKLMAVDTPGSGDKAAPGDTSDNVPFTDEQLARVDYDTVLMTINQEYDSLVAAMKIDDAAAPRPRCRRRKPASWPTNWSGKRSSSRART